MASEPNSSTNATSQPSDTSQNAPQASSTMSKSAADLIEAIKEVLCADKEANIAANAAKECREALRLFCNDQILPWLKGIYEKGDLADITEAEQLLVDIYGDRFLQYNPAAESLKDFLDSIRSAPHQASPASE